MKGMPPNHHGFIPSSQEEALRRRVKAELRKRMRGLRNALPAQACAGRSKQIAERLMALAPMEQAKAVALFSPMSDRHEVDVLSLHASLQKRGTRIAFPSIEAETGSMEFRFVDDLAALEERGSGPREPGPGAQAAVPGEIDVIVVPALAVDPRGHRIGYGAGYYDRALPRFAPPAASVCVAFDFQLVAEVPDLGQDVATHWVVTDARSFAANAIGET
jgi:5-formyltetrahydrofolate cyclo-ligase